jgi:hypothetical protein
VTEIRRLSEGSVSTGWPVVAAADVLHRSKRRHHVNHVCTLFKS